MLAGGRTPQRSRNCQVSDTPPLDYHNRDTVPGCWTSPPGDA
jgi:hypothetical protein